MVEVYNLGNRVILHNKVKINPKKVTKVEEDLAKKLFKMYPKELVEWGKELPSEKKSVAEMTLEQARAMVAAADSRPTEEVTPIHEDDPELEEEDEEEKETETKKSKKGKK